jgi:hypothetical protein
MIYLTPFFYKVTLLLKMAKVELSGCLKSPHLCSLGD